MRRPLQCLRLRTALLGTGVLQSKTLDMKMDALAMKRDIIVMTQNVRPILSLVRPEVRTDGKNLGDAGFLSLGSRNGWQQAHARKANRNFLRLDS